MKVYRVIEDSAPVLTTVNELEALRRYRKAMEKFYEKTDQFAFIDEDVI